MQKVIVTGWAIFAAASVAEAQQDTRTRAAFFAEKRVNFWHADQSARPAPEQPVTESIWAEPTRLPDGRYTTYLPPRAVLQFLENPTRETAQKYLDWQAQRMDKLKKAAAILGEVQQEKSAKAVDQPQAAAGPVTITYFKKAG